MNGKINSVLKLAVFALLILILISTVSFAHEEDEEDGSVNAIFERIHWYIFLLAMITCYYFRGFSERSIFGRPRSCSMDYGENYKGDRTIYQLHRVFFWLALPSIIIFLFFNALAIPEIFSGNFELLQMTTKTLEFFVGLVFLLYLLGCHHLRFLFGLMADSPGCRGCWKLKLYNKQSRLNSVHDYLFWLAVIGIIALHVFFIFGGHAG